jgi:hypothetical protein
MSRASTAHATRSRYAVRHAFCVLAGVTVTLLAFAACGGDDDSTPAPTDGGARDASCDPRLPSGWAPTWRPPRAVLHACSDAQIETELRLCESDSTYSASACAAFNRDPANAACRQCLYSTEDEDVYGPFVYLRNRILRINVPGCVALADGQLGATGCGAQLHAFQACGDAACMTSGAAFDDFTECVARSEDSVCRPYRLDSACGERATYAPCLDLGNFADYYRGLAKLFCGAGFPGGGDGGAPDAGRDGAAEVRFSFDDLRRSKEIRTRTPRGEGITR